MAGTVVRSPLSILFYVLATAAAAQAANVTADEEYWAKRAVEAGSYNRGAHVSDPIATMNRFNNDVQKSTAARRSLRRRYKGPCVAANPIDQCWRCRGNWANNRKRLARCAMGFGHKATGGLAGKIYVVTDPSDDFLNMIIPKKGTLRYAVIQDRPLWITFARDMIIQLSQELIVSNDKTIDGRGAQVHITGAQITLQNVNNIIIHDLHIHNSVPHLGGLIRDSKHHFGFRGQSDGDGISVIGSSNIWIDHVSMYNCSDGLIDVIDGSTAITISNGHFTKHDHVMLFGASDDSVKDKIMQITVAFNHFGKGLVQRMPRCRYGFFHVVNNDYTHWLMYAIGGNKNPTIISQGNRFRAVDDRNYKEVTKREYTPYNEYRDWVWKSQDDVFLNGAFFNQSGGQNQRVYDILDFIAAKSGQYVEALTQFAGTLNCRVGKKC
ncbi:pectate lyase-like [Phragmites australis]|uniref:pectate lyase-like n=1 Tax=Phragmites australis TaxID=29695 RepID=UPI002D79DDD6|nr:pectate lyase-like [Phragmites australis]